LELVPLEEFMARTVMGRPNQMDVTPYVGHEFECPCGVRHSFDPFRVKVLRELTWMRLVVSCPQGEAVTCVKVRGIFRFKGFKSLFGAHCEAEPDSDSEEDDGPNDW